MGRPILTPSHELPPPARRLDEVITEMGLNRKEFAERLGMSPSGFRCIFQKGVKVTTVMAKAIECEFGINHQWLLNGEGPKNKRQRINLNNHKNKVELLSATGGDIAHARAAWASTGKKVEEEKHRIPALLEMLADSDHGTPFEHSQISYLVTSEIATHIQFLKHRAGVSINSESARYKELKEDKFYIPEDWPDELIRDYRGFVEDAQQRYHEVVTLLENHGLERSRAKESARFYLPYGTQITYVVTMNFRSFIHFLNLRMTDHAQQEICDIARAMLKLLQGNGDFYHSLAAFDY